MSSVDRLALLQVKILKKCKNFLLLNKKNNLVSNPMLFLTSWAYEIGNLNLQKISGKNISILKKIYFLFKIIFSNNFIKNVSYDNTKKSKKKFKNLVVSYLDNRNFYKNFYYDKYFNINTNKLKNTLLVLVPVEKKIILNNFKNLIILKLNYKNYIFNFILTFIEMVNLLFYFIFFKKKYNLKLSDSNFNKQLCLNLTKIIKLNKIRNVYFPYEAQPHQHIFTKEIRKKKIKVIGYMHTALPALPSDYIKRDGNPNVVLVNGLVQKKIMVKFLGWNKNEVKNIDSLRYSKNISISDLQRKIFLPYDFENIFKYINLFKKLLQTKVLDFYPKFDIKNHPAKNNSYKHIFLKNFLENFIKKNKKVFLNKKSNTNISLFIGSTSSILECLERGVNVIHLSNYPIFDYFNSTIWSGLISTKVSENIFLYKIKNKGSIIKIVKKPKLIFN